MTMRIAVEEVIAADATQARKWMQEGVLSAEAYAQVCLERVWQRDAAIHAWSATDPEAVLRNARALDLSVLAGQKPGPLHGLPVGVKDVILTSDFPTQYNSPLFDGFHPRIDASCVSLLRSAGALVFGKTATVEFAATGRRADTANPRNPLHTPGGSSSGSAAAVADSHVPLALGTQTGGSMLRPASYCGVYGIKPTWNLVSNEGAKAFSASLDTIGWFARSAQDLALLYQVFDPEPGDIPVLQLAAARVMVYRSPAWPHAQEATIQAMDEAIVRLREAGAMVVEVVLSDAFARMGDAQNVIMRGEGRAALLAAYRIDAAERLAGSHAARQGVSLVHHDIRGQVENAAQITRARLRDAYDLAAQGRLEFEAKAAEFDFVLTPSTTGSAPRGLDATGSFAFNSLWSLLQVPCINVPGLRDAGGMPIGVTVTGPRFSDRRMLSAAAALGDLLSR